MAEPKKQEIKPEFKIEEVKQMKAADLVGKSLAEKPEINQSAIDAQNKRDADEAKAKNELPEKPVGGAKRGPKPGSHRAQPAKGTSYTPPDASFSQACRKAGEATADSIMLAGLTFGGPVWLPIQSPVHDERMVLRTAYADFFEYYGWSKMHPGIALIIATGSYGGPRWFHPDTQARIALIKASFTKKKQEASKEEKPSKHTEEAKPIETKKALV